MSLSPFASPTTHELGDVEIDGDGVRVMVGVIVIVGVTVMVGVMALPC